MMCLRNLLSRAAAIAAFLMAATCCSAQVVSPAPSPQSAPVKSQQQESIKVFTEEVVLPVFVLDEQGRFDPTLEINDLLVLEDGVQQQVRSIRREPASVLLLLDTAGGENPAMKTNVTRDLAIRLISHLRAGDRVAALQFGGRVELIQSWTTETESVNRTLKTKLSSGQPARLAEALLAAASQLKEVPAGSRHVVLITDGGKLSSDQEGLAKAMENILSAQATVHVISYTALGRKMINKLHPKFLVRVITNKTDKRKSAQDTADELTKPNEPETLEEMSRFTIYLVIENDFRMWRKSRRYATALKESEQWLRLLAEETGGSFRLPESTEEIIKQADEVAREIGSQYVVTYTPKRPLAPGRAGEVRRVQVAARRIGLQVHSRRRYIVTALP